MNVSLPIAQMYAGLIVVTITTMFKTSLKNLSNAYGLIYTRDNLTVLAAMSLVLGIAATIAAPFFIAMPWWQYAAIAPATMVIGTAALSTAQLIGAMVVDVANAAWSLVRSMFSGFTAAKGATA